MNLARNIGGSCGTSFFVTVLARRAQDHQDRLAMFFNSASIQLRQAIDGLSRHLLQGGLTGSTAQARALAQGSIYRQLVMQSTQLAYLDVVAILSIGSACMIPLVFFMKKRKAAGPAAAH